jgi:hypothetical protein
MRLPARHGQPLEPLEMSEADIVGFGEQIMSGFRGQAQWRQNGNHEEMVVDLHPDAANYLPPGVYVIAVGRRYKPLGPDGRGGTSFGVQFLLGRDLDSTVEKVLRGGVKEETTLYTSPPPEGEETSW